MMTGFVSKLWRYPVKSMLGEECRHIDLDGRGVSGDRLFAIRDTDGRFGSGKSTRRFRHMEGLFGFRASCSAHWPDILFPDGRRMRGGDPGIHDALSAALGIPVTLAREEQVPHLDAGPVHLVSTSALAWLGLQLPGSRADERRFRPNIVVTTPGVGQSELSWLDRTLRVGADVRLRVTAPTERCRMTTLAQDDLPTDPGILRCIAENADLQFGVYAEVVQPGRVSFGDAVVLDSAT